MGKSTNKTSAAIERLANYGDVLVWKGQDEWGVRVFATSTGNITANNLDDALNAALRKLEGI